MGIVRPPVTQLRNDRLISKGLVGCWPFMESAGTTVRDISGNNYHAEAQVSTQQNQWEGTEQGQSLRFIKANNDWLEFAGGRTDILSGYEGITVAVWVNFVSTPTGSTHMFSKYYEGGVVRGWLMYSLSGAFRFECNTDTLEAGRQAVGAAPVVGQWQHVAGTWSSEDGNNRIFVDGVEGTPIAQPGNTVKFGNARVRAGDDPVRGFQAADAHMHDFRIYNRKLSKAEINLIGAGLG